jgi:cell division protein FtsB
LTPTPENPTLGLRVAQFAYRSRRRIATALAILCALFLGYHVIFGQNGLTIYQQKRQEDKALSQQIQQLKQENSRLKAHTERLQGDSNAIEHEAREKLHYTRPGEVIYTLDDKPKSDAKNPTP